ncbi:MAG: hypothetical protein MUF64_30710, partial [Polyangiaceae bacterium]|nr:hypothetical protein [Polyangiaceae bacterium]
MNPSWTRLRALLVGAALAPFACAPSTPPGAGPRAAAPFWPLGGSYGSTWGTPLTFQQNGDRASGRFERNGVVDCVWDASGVYLCAWRSDAGSGLARIWWQGDRPTGLYGVGQSADNGGRLDFWQVPANAATPAAPTGGLPGVFGPLAGLPALPFPGMGGPPPATNPPATNPPTTSAPATAAPTATIIPWNCQRPEPPPPTTMLGASCNSNTTCPDDMRCLGGKCAVAAGTRCGTATD